MHLEVPRRFVSDVQFSSWSRGQRRANGRVIANIGARSLIGDDVRRRIHQIFSAGKARRSRRRRKRPTNAFVTKFSFESNLTNAKTFAQVKWRIGYEDQCDEGLTRREEKLTDSNVVTRVLRARIMLMIEEKTFLQDVSNPNLRERNSSTKRNERTNEPSCQADGRCSGKYSRAIAIERRTAASPSVFRRFSL